MQSERVHIEVYYDGFCIFVDDQKYAYDHSDPFDTAAIAIKEAIEHITSDTIEVSIEEII